MSIKASVVLLILLALGGHAAAFRMKGRKPPHASRISGTTVNDPRTARAQQIAKLKEELDEEKIVKALKNGLQAGANVDCKAIPIAVNNSLSLIANLFQGMECDKGECELSESTQDSLSDMTYVVLNILALADTKRCLEDVMADETVKQAVGHVNGLWDVIISGMPREDQPLMREAGVQLKEWRMLLADLSGSMIDRDLLFPENIQLTAVCPAPCKECSKAHNSWYKNKEQFKFKCILDPSDDAPDDPRLDCEEPRRRFTNPWESKTWCAVHDWKAKAFQKATLEASLTCAALAIVTPLSGIGSIPGSIYQTCLLVEQGAAVPAEDRQKYQKFSEHAKTDTVRHKVFSIFMTLGLADALTSIREQSSGNRQPADSISIGDGVVPMDLLSKCEPRVRHVGHAFMAVGKVVFASLMLIPTGSLAMLSWLYGPGFLAGMVLALPLIPLAIFTNVFAVSMSTSLFLLEVGKAACFIWAVMGTVGGEYFGYGPVLIHMVVASWKGLAKVWDPALNWLSSYVTSPKELLPEMPSNCPASHVLTKTGEVQCLAAMNFGDSTYFRCGAKERKWISVNCSEEYGGAMVLDSGC